MLVSLCLTHARTNTHVRAHTHTLTLRIAVRDTPTDTHTDRNISTNMYKFNQSLAFKPSHAARYQTHPTDSINHVLMDDSSITQHQIVSVCVA